jgi:hypothetical protein
VPYHAASAPDPPVIPKRSEGYAFSFPSVGRSLSCERTRIFTSTFNTRIFDTMRSLKYIPRRFRSIVTTERLHG